MKVKELIAALQDLKDASELDVYIVTRKGYAPEDAVLISTMMTDVHVADIADLPITERAVIVDTASPMRMRLP